MNWPYFIGASLAASVLLVWWGAPLLPIAAGVALAGLWKALGSRR